MYKYMEKRIGSQNVAYTHSTEIRKTGKTRILMMDITYNNKRPAREKLAFMKLELKRTPERIILVVRCQ